MGCDIHFHSEVKIKGEWRHYSSNDIKRNYRLFSKMANVRNSDRSEEPISRPKGLPKDISDITKLCADQWNSDGHSHSWLSADEITTLYEWMRKIDLTLPYELNFPYFCGNDFAEFKLYPEDWPQEIEDVRYVFWFDN